MKKQTYWETWKDIMGDPEIFYEKLFQKQDKREPTIFALKTYAIQMGVIYIFLLIILFFISVIARLLSPSVNKWLALGTLIYIISFPLLILLRWLSIYIGAGILHLFTLIFQAKSSFTTTYNTYSYSLAPRLLGFIPFIGFFLVIYQIILLVIGINKQHKLTIGKSIAVVLLPVLIIATLSFICYILAIILLNLVIPAYFPTYFPT